MKQLSCFLFAVSFCHSLYADNPIEFPYRNANGDWILNACLYTVAFSPDETMMAAAGSLGIFLVDLQSETFDIVNWLPIENETVQNLQFSSDGHSLLTILRTIESRPFDYLQLWDINNGNKMQSYSVPNSRFVYRSNTYPNAIVCACISPDRSLILTGNSDSTASLLDVHTGEIAYTLDAHSYKRTDIGYDAGTTAAAFAPDGKTFLTGGRDGVIKMWDTDTGSEIRQYNGHTGQIHNLRFSQDGSRFLSNAVRRTDDRVIHVWNTASGEIVASASGHTDTVFDVRWIDGESRLISASQNALIKVWNAQSGEEELSIPSQFESNLSVLSPKGNWLYTDYPSGDRNIWNLSDLDSISSRTLDFHTYSDAAITPDNRYFVTEEYNRMLFWKFDEGRPSIVREIGIDDSYMWKTSFSPDGRYMLAISYPEQELRIWDLETFELVFTILRGEFSAFNTGLDYAEFSSNGDRLAVVFNDIYVRVIDWKKGEVLQSVMVDGIAPAWATLSPEGNKLLTCHSTHGRYSLRLWDVETGDVLWSNEEISARIQPIQTLVDGEWVCASIVESDNEETSVIALWDGDTGDERQIVLDCPELSGDVQFSRDGRFVWASEPYVGVKLFDAHTGKVRKDFPQTSSVDISNDGTWAVTNGYGSVRLWNLNLPSTVPNWKALR